MSNKGYEIQIQTDLSQQQFSTAILFIKNFINYVKENDGSWVERYSRGGWASYLRRNGYGRLIKSHPEDLLFRRIRNKSRVFAVVKCNTVTKPDTEGQCCCPKCIGNQKIYWKNNKEPKMYSVYKTGNIKG